jgi:heterodisulfide reductase subunit C
MIKGLRRIQIEAGGKLELISEGTTEEADGKEKDKNDITDTESMPYITEEELDSEFKYEILNEPGGENFMRCMQCGTCTASCPVKVIDPANGIDR